MSTHLARDGTPAPIRRPLPSIAARLEQYKGADRQLTADELAAVLERSVLRTWRILLDLRNARGLQARVLGSQSPTPKPCPA